jgi:hypothetical protein
MPRIPPYSVWHWLHRNMGCAYPVRRHPTPILDPDRPFFIRLRAGYLLRMARRRRIQAFLVGVAIATIALAAAAPAGADVGIEKVSRHAGAPGETVELTVACGFCFPPCQGPPGHRTPSPCMLGTKRQPPESFPVSLVPLGRAPEPRACGPNALCPARVSAPPARFPFSLLGAATPPAPGSEAAQAADRENVPRYLLSYAIPNVRPGVYTYVLFCDACAGGKAGSLIAAPGLRLWRLRVRPAGPF